MPTDHELRALAARYLNGLTTNDEERRLMRLLMETVGLSPELKAMQIMLEASRPRQMEKAGKAHIRPVFHRWRTLVSAGLAAAVLAGAFLLLRTPEAAGPLAQTAKVQPAQPPSAPDTLHTFAPPLLAASGQEKRNVAPGQPLASRHVHHQGGNKVSGSAEATKPDDSDASASPSPTIDDYIAQAAETRSAMHETALAFLEVEE